MSRLWASEERSAGGVAKVRSALGALYLGIAGYVAVLLWGALLASAGASLGLPASPVVRYVAASVGTALGAATLAFFYVRWTDRNWSFFDVEVPGRREAALVVAAVVALVGVNFLAEFLGVGVAEHGFLAQAREEPLVLLVGVPMAVLFVGPGEELLYRNVVQKALYGTFPAWAAVVVASAVFALVHYPAFATATATAASVLGALALVFLLSLVLGAVYDRTRNVVAAGLAHGVYDAVVFVGAYLELTGAL